jgi:hypothetical protein
VPAAQLVQLVEFGAKYWPALHSTQEVAAATKLYFPNSQVVH